MRSFVDGVAAGTHAAAGWPSSAYRVSKMGVNALAGVLARELAGDPRKILVNAACPGWVRTAMGGAGAPRSVEEGARTPVWLATLPEGGPQGGVFADEQPSDW
jgi:carbonyl reductase 1